MLSLRVLWVVRVIVDHVTYPSHPLREGVVLQDVVHIGGREVTVTHNSYKERFGGVCVWVGWGVEGWGGGGGGGGEDHAGTSRCRAVSS